MTPKSPLRVNDAASTDDSCRRHVHDGGVEGRVNDATRAVCTGTSPRADVVDVVDRCNIAAAKDGIRGRSLTSWTPTIRGDLITFISSGALSEVGAQDWADRA